MRNSDYTSIQHASLCYDLGRSGEGCGLVGRLETFPGVTHERLSSRFASDHPRRPARGEIPICTKS